MVALDLLLLLLLNSLGFSLLSSLSLAGSLGILSLHFRSTNRKVQPGPPRCLNRRVYACSSPTLRINATTLFAHRLQSAEVAMEPRTCEGRKDSWKLLPLRSSQLLKRLSKHAHSKNVNCTEGQRTYSCARLPKDSGRVLWKRKVENACLTTIQGNIRELVVCQIQMLERNKLAK